jgi:hypothetical protein
MVTQEWKLNFARRQVMILGEMAMHVMRMGSEIESTKMFELRELDLETRPQEGFDRTLRPTETAFSERSPSS